ncbi:hypothetical protein CMO92_01145 [Candidatus Woesearchaeota archaeon]|nr:hypothetical protein [Candidatus Woesearchaeota archaeon]|tara:strand:- start:416 stop:1045 length:630 start_codon:yes stop_codon:yes gene_type:complete
METLLNQTHIHPREIAKKLYNPKDVGVLVLPYALPKSTRGQLILEYVDHPFIYSENNEEEHFDDCSTFVPKLKHKPVEPLSLEQSLPITYQLHQELQQLYSEITRHAKLSSGNLNSIIIQNFKKGSKGLSNRTEPSDTSNMAIAGVLSGQAFFYANSPTCFSIYKAPVGSLILVRAQIPANQELLPTYALGRVDEERTLLWMREKTQEN